MNHSKAKVKRDRSIDSIFGGYAWYAAILAALFAYLFYISPAIADDLWFEVSDADSGGFMSRLSGAAQIQMSRLQTDMIRLTNQVVPYLINCVPRLLVSLLIWGVIMLTLEGGRRLSGIGRSGWPMALWVGAFFIFLPWYDYMLAVSYLSNYLMSSCLVLWTLWYFERVCRVRRGRHPGVGLLALAFMAGWCHEGFSAPMICGMLVMLSVVWHQQKRLPSIGLCVLIVAVMGMSVIFMSPILRERLVKSEGSAVAMPMWEFMLQLGPSLLLLTAAAALSIPALVRRFWRPRLLMLLTMAVTAEVVAVVAYNGPRTAWSAELYSLITLLSLCSEYSLPRNNMLVNRLTTYGVLLIVGVNLVAAIVAQRRLTREYEDVMQMYAASDDGVVYYDVTTPKADLTLLKTSVRALNERMPMSFVSTRYSSGSKQLVIVPTALRGYKADGELRNNGVSVCNNRVVALPEAFGRPGGDAATIESPLTGLMKVESENGEIIYSRYSAYAFEGADKEQYYYVSLHAQVLNDNLRIKSATPVK